LVAESFHLGAYWGPRAESVDACAARLARFLAELAEVTPILGSWFKKAGSRKAALKHRIEPSVEELRRLLWGGRARRDFDRSVISELGFSEFMWNGQDVEVGLSVSCGAYTTTPGLISNVVVLRLPEAEGEALELYQRRVALAVMRSAVTVWEPSWATWTNHRLREVQESLPGKVVVGWATYVAGCGGVPLGRLPAGTTVEQVGGGLLVVADGEAYSVSEATVLAIRAALGDAVHLTSSAEPPGAGGGAGERS